MRDYGPFGDAAGDRIALLLEAGQHWERASLQAARNVLMRFLVGCGCAGAQRRALRLAAARRARARAADRHTPRGGTQSMHFEFTQDFHGGETIHRAGTPIAHDAGEPVCTPYDDCVLVMPSVRQLRPGVTTVRLGQRVHAGWNEPFPKLPATRQRTGAH
jgi:hypothetical protein